MKCQSVKYRAFEKAIVLMTAVLTVLCAVLALNVKVKAAGIIDNGDYVYKIQEDGKSVSIVSYRGNSLYVSLPSSVDNYKVTSVDAAAFMSNETIKELEIASTIKTIHSNAFAECTALKKLVIPGSLEEIGDSAFVDCTSLQSVTISDGAKKIGEYCFAGCKNLSNLSLPNSLEEIGEYAFFGCSSLEKAAVPKAIQRLGAYALEGTKWMQNQKSEFVVVGDGMLIKYNGKKNAVTLPDSIKIIGECAFAKNDAITKITLPRTTAKIEKSAFEDCTSLETVSFSDNVVSIGERAFRNCKVLGELTLPKKLSEIAASCFENCTNMLSITIPSGVKSIEMNSFKGCIMLESVQFQNGLQNIHSFAFEDCIGLGSLTFPETLKDIDSEICYNCHSLTRVEFNSSVNIPSAAFSDCIHLTDVVFYQNPANIEINAFNRCSRELTLYSDNSQVMQDYAKENKYQSETIQNLPAYVSQGILKPDDDSDKNLFSSGYTAITIMIVIIDFGIVVFFTCYILFSQPKGKHGRARNANNAKYSQQNVKSSSAPQTTPKPQSKPQPQNSAPRPPKKPVPKHIAPKDKK